MPKKLTKQEKDIIKLAKSGGTDKELVILRKIHEMEDEFNDVMETFKTIKKNLADNFKNESAIVEKLFDEINEKLIVKLALKITKLKKGDKGDSPTEKELLGLIKPLVPSKITDEQLKALIIPLIPEVKNGKDADEEKIIEEIKSQIEIPTIEDIADQLPEMGEEVRDALELLQGDERLKWEAIRGLKEKFKEMKEQIDSIPIGKLGGGGTSDLGVKASLSRVVKTETPTGNINGSNKTYTTTTTINAVLSFGINGMVIHDDEYSISGKTITFTTALPAALSGKSFKIVYV